MPGRQLSARACARSRPLASARFKFPARAASFAARRLLVRRLPGLSEDRRGMEGVGRERGEGETPLFSRSQVKDVRSRRPHGTSTQRRLCASGGRRPPLLSLFDHGQCAGRLLCVQLCPKCAGLRRQCGPVCQPFLAEHFSLVTGHEVQELVRRLTTPRTVRAFTCKGVSAGIGINAINALDVRWKPRDMMTTGPPRLPATTPKEPCRLLRNQTSREGPDGRS
ncbi:hypothetical protein HPB50_009615 [Hyalomma asiaticum]|uniref:Uncharacterized protein n=1 Tax=Hyalomma asiaticum TaxID=266040 RepID=A0ACB7TH92_HYAAI|nr:hypothetical protein HPB50_009615 [Hyalomma asiaticum]